ncbi:MAG: radical SAM protein [Myxococcales bacterium]|nr:radical SAM protein [Myxococcales bacterium]
MRWTDLRVGTTCNQACRFCDQSDLAGDGGDDAVIEAMRALPHRDGLCLAGGEITLRPGLPMLLRTARQLGFRKLAVQTNGQILATPGAARALSEAGLDAVTLALHGTTAAVHDWHTATPGSFRRVIAAAKQAIAAGLAVRIGVVVTRANSGQLAGMVDLGHAVGAGSMRMVLCREEGAAQLAARMLAPRWSVAAEALVPAAERARQHGLDLELAGLPPCLAGDLRPLLADGPSVRQADRAYVAGAVTREAPAYPAPCQGCALAPSCPGVEAAYLRRWGPAELRPVGAPSPEGAEIVLSTAAGATSRTLRQQLVQAQARGARVVRLVEPLPDLAGLVRDAERLGLTVVRAPS